MPRSQSQVPIRLEAIRREADKCVKCALCAPLCPTYLDSLDENESPRGRISLMQGVAGGQLKLVGALRRHLDHCLDCRACEKVCPSGVRYGALLDATRALAPVRIGPRWRLLRGLLVRPGARWLLHAGAGLLRDAGLGGRLGLPPRRWAGAPRRAGEIHGKVILFAGCSGRLLDAAALDAARRILARLGFAVAAEVTDCCGALHQHDGDADTALALARRNLQRFDALKDGDRDLPLVFLATGCGAQLKDYPLLAWKNEEERARAAAFAEAVQEISTFVAPRLREAALPLRPLAKTLYVHEPCSQRNVLRGSDATYELLSLIPQAEVRALPDNEHCCGGAGSFMLTQARLSRAVFARKLARIEETMLRPREVITSNPGCAMMFRRAGMMVRHPLEVIAGQLEETVTSSE